ncbi:alpha/beta fold hydrolase [Microbulbifer sp. 2205BS26-8]|uniref:alpha/beta fold hydrolase n=1 Tax=Microbulbifer sp. 2205BS26-8 TaxID=3064386 RepID=UPI00273F4D9D|nr:alpha/beta fold hydrolase [Microbulbifer sp. 2205BS26-8]MDP5210744.1 alpha/beta fold hydrolase [Microbulbifer sp. 2205BS26-8]
MGSAVIKQTGYSDVHLEFDSKAIAGRRWGSVAGEPVLALHGWLDNCASFDRLAPMLKGVNLVALDMAGHGRSYHRSPHANYNIWEETEDILGAVEALGWRRFSLLAHSRGAIAGMIAAGAFPGRVKRLALIDGLVPPSAEDAQAPDILARAIAQRARYTRMRKAPVYQTFTQAVEARMNGMFPLSAWAARVLTERGVRPVVGGFTWSNDPRLMATSTAKLNGAQIRAFMSRLNMPVRLVLAEGGIEGMIERLRPVLKGYENIAVQVMAGSHHLHMESGAEGIAAWFGPFLRGEADPVA